LPAPLEEPRRKRVWIYLDWAFVLAGIAILILFVTKYQMPFRLDDVLHIQWAQEHTFWDAWHPVRGEIVRSVRPIFAATIWLLTHYAGMDDYLPWHITLVLSFLIALAFAGLTSRYISQRNSPLYFTTGLFWFAFTPILNFLFWYGDLTFTIELLFVTPAWYFGLRALFEKKIGFWLLAMFSGSMAVMSKEPALVLVHGVLVGSAIVRFKELKEIWRNNATKKWLFVVLYLLFLGVSLYVLFVSPTRSNRFFSLNSEDANLSFFIKDRLRYYSDVLLSLQGRLLLVTPIIYVAIIGLLRKNRDFELTRPGKDIFSVLGALVFSAAIAVVFISSLPALAIALLASCIIAAVTMKHERKAALLMLPFAICAITILAALLITVALVKTQLTELSVTLLVIVGWAWSRVTGDLVRTLQPVLKLPRMQLLFTIAGVATAFVIIYGFRYKIEKQERLLTDVRNVRLNSNDAIKWAAKHLPYRSVLGVAGYQLHGIGAADDLTSKDDGTKLRQQYTFLQGYIRIYLQNLGRHDISVAYLEDTTLVNEVLDSMRSEGNTYVFLQSDLDLKRFHGDGIRKPLLTMWDTMVCQFKRPPYPTEIWHVRKQLYTIPN